MDYVADILQKQAILLTQDIRLFILEILNTWLASLLLNISMLIIRYSFKTKG